jgi:hypothetical protein
MPLTEIVGNMHMHTPYSDGEGYHAEIAQAAIKAGLDFVIVTDHNIWVSGIPPYHYSPDGKRRVLVLTGEEVHDQALQPQSNHLLVYNTRKELAALAYEPQLLIDAVNEAAGLCFLAHPFDYESKLIHYEPIDWRRWDVNGFHGLEIWNYMSEFVRLVTTPTQAIRFAADPSLGISGPNPETLKKWDELLAEGKKVVGIGNSDAHATKYHMFRRSAVVFPYEFLFGAVNTHLLADAELNGDYDHDSELIYSTLRAGRCFVGYDQPASTKGFRFSAQGDKSSAGISDEIQGTLGVTMQVAVPAKADIRLVRNGKVVKQKEADTHLTYITSEPGAYRVEAHIFYKGEKRGWIYSNPIYVR